jgi:hypothetical protein
LQQARSALKYFVVSIAAVSLLAAVGCGTGNPVLLNPMGNFSNSSLNGEYVYQIRGGDALNNLFPYREVGVFVADGQGHIGSTTPGSDDTSFSATGTPVTGTYQIFRDGTGSISMTTQLGPVTLAVTMVSASKLYLMEADAGVNSTGVAELQDPAAIGAAPNGSFAFRIHEEVSLTNQAPAAQVGAFTVPGNGVNGAMDQNAGGAFSSPNLTWVFNAPGALGRGTGTYLNASTNVTNNFIYYIVNSSKIGLLVTDASVVGSGVAEAQSGAIGSGLSGTYAFGRSGDDLSGFFGTVAAVGEFTAAGGNLTGVQDDNIDGNTTANVATAGCYTASANGRVPVVSVSGNTCSNSVVQVYWMVNPNRAFFLDLNAGVFDDGTADLQTTPAFTSTTMSGQYALGMGGIDGSPELLSRIGTLQFNAGSKLVLNELVNASGSGVGGQTPAGGLLTGSDNVSANGRITATVGNSAGALDLVMYGVSRSKAYVLQNDAGFVTSGTVEVQP